MNEYSIKDIAELVGVSKTAIRKTIKEAGVEYDRIEKNKQVFGYEKTREIIKFIRSDFDFSDFEKFENHKPQTENQNEILEKKTETETPKNENQDANQEPQTENKEKKTETNIEAELLKTMLHTLQEQIAIKDKQIAAYEEQIKNKDKQIVDYSERLKEALELTKGQQYIAAAEKTAKIIDKGYSNSTEITEVNEETVESDNKKKSFWKRIFG